MIKLLLSAYILTAAVAWLLAPYACCPRNEQSDALMASPVSERFENISWCESPQVDLAAVSGLPAGLDQPFSKGSLKALPDPIPDLAPAAMEQVNKVQLVSTGTSESPVWHSANISPPRQPPRI